MKFVDTFEGLPNPVHFNADGIPLPMVKAAANKYDRGTLTSVHFLMSCHSTPYYSHLHHLVPMRMLDCSPPLDPSPTLYHPTEVQLFEENPILFMQALYSDAMSAEEKRLGYPWNNEEEARREREREREASHLPMPEKSLPSHIIVFDNNKRDFELVMGRHYTLVKTFFHSHFVGDRHDLEKHGAMCVYTRRSFAELHGSTDNRHRQEEILGNSGD